MEKKLSAIALTYASPREPTDGRTPEELTALFEHKGSGLTPLIGMMNHVRRPSLRGGHVERIEHDGRVQRVLHGPADDATTEHIKDDREVEKARGRRHVGDVGDPELIRRRRAEGALHEIRREGRLWYSPTGPRRSTALRDTAETLHTHQARDAFAADAIADLA